jgi:putative transposase
VKDSLWSLDLFRCESATLRTHRGLIVMDQFSRRIIGLVSTAASLMGWRCAGCSIESILEQSLPKYLSTDNDPLYRFDQWQANLRLLEAKPIMTVPYVPLSYAFVAR